MISNHAPSSDIIVKGSIKHFPAKTIYIVDANYWTVMLDSAEVKNGTFIFKLSRKKYDPFLASLVFKNKENKLQFLSFKVPSKFSVTQSGISETNSFMLDLNSNIVEGEITGVDAHNSTNPLEIKPSKENDIYFTYLNTSFNISSSDPDLRQTQIESIGAIISKNDNSFYLLSTLNKNKRFWKPEELTKVLSRFDRTLLESNVTKEINDYMKAVGCKDCAFPNAVVISNRNEEKIELTYSKGKTNLIIFWASWCVPCRNEIPMLKLIYKEFKDRGLIMNSISVDDNPSMWHTALKDEKMEWPQYIIPKNTITEFQNSFNFLTIPVIILVDRKGKELKRIIGLSENNSQMLTAYLNMVLPR